MVCEKDEVLPKELFIKVLILVLMEYGLREKEGKLTLRGHLLVLILVLMEYGLRGSNL